MASLDVDALRSQVHATATDPALDPGERVAAMRRIADLALSARDSARAQLQAQLDLISSLTTLLGSVDTYSEDAQMRREAEAADLVMAKAQLREDADLREQLIREGVDPEQLDRMGMRSHDELDQMDADGTLTEAAFGLAANFKEWKVKRAHGRFATQNIGPDGGGAPGAPAAPAPRPAAPVKRGGKRASGGGARPTQGYGKDFIGAGPHAGGTQQQPPRYEVPKEEPKAPASPGTAEAISRIRSMEDIQDQLAEVAKYGLNDWPTKGKLATKLLGNAKDTQDLHMVDLPASPGTGGGKPRRGYSKKRKVVHDAIIGSFLAGPMEEILGHDHAITRKLRGGGTLSSSEKQQVREAASRARGGDRPQALFMAGGPASGKTSALKAANLEPPASVTINPDEMKDRLPEYRAMIEGGEKFAASGVHEESSDLGKRLQSEAMDLGLNVVVDGTGDSKPGKFKGKFEDMDKAGYDVNALYVTIPTDEAVVRATTRAMKSGRWVPEPELRSQHKNVSGNFEEVATLPFIRDLKLYDNSGPSEQEPRLIAEASGGQVQVHDEPSYTGFLAKREEGA